MKRFCHLAFKFNLIPGEIIRFNVHLFITKAHFGKDLICQKVFVKDPKKVFFLRQEGDLIHFFHVAVSQPVILISCG